MLRWAVRRRRRWRRWSRRRWRRRWRACRRIARDRRVDDWVQPGERRHLSCHLSHTLVALGVETRLRGARAEREGDACDGERGLALVAAVYGPRAWSRLPNQAFLCQKPWALPQPTRSWVHTQSEAKSSTTVWSRKTCAHKEYSQENSLANKESASHMKLEHAGCGLGKRRDVGGAEGALEEGGVLPCVPNTRS